MATLYQFNLPIVSNDRRPYDAALASWEQRAVEKAGGLTACGEAIGSWADAGTLYREPMRVYQVATDADTASDLLADAFELFPDQLAIFHAELGTAHIAARPVTAKAVTQ